MLPVEPPVALLLVAIALVAGVGITSLGPGGIFVTIALFVLAPITSAEVAGTASATFVATGLLGTAAYGRSGEFAAGPARELAILLSLASVLGALVGTQLNLRSSERLFGLLLGAFVLLVGLSLLYREWIGLAPVDRLAAATPRTRRTSIVAIGLAVGAVGGLLGVGGPVLAVPLLVTLGTPMLVALAAAQLQSVFLAGAATIGYAAAGAVSLPLVVLVGVPQLAGVLVGWRLAHRLDPHRLRLALGVVLLAVAPAIAL